MKHFVVRHQYKWRQIVKIIRRHLYIKKPLQEFLEYTYEKNKEEINKQVYDKMLYGQ